MSTSGAACFLHNLLVIVTISGWILSERCPYFTASVLIALDLPPANHLDFFFSGTTLTSDLLFQHLFWGSLPLTFIPSSLLHFFLIHIGFYFIYFTIDFHLVVIFIQSNPCSGPRIFSLNCSIFARVSAFCFLTKMLFLLLTQQFLLFLLTASVLWITWSNYWNFPLMLFCYFSLMKL